MSEHDDDFEVRDLREPRHFWTDNEVYTEYAAVIGPYAFAVYGALCFHANAKAEAWPSVKTLGENLAMSVQSVRKALLVLKDHDLIKIENRWDEAGDRTSNMYTLRSVKSLQRRKLLEGGSTPQVLPPTPQGLPPETEGVVRDGYHPLRHRYQGSTPQVPRGSTPQVHKENPGKQQSGNKKNAAAAAAAAAVFGAIISPTDALRLVETHPECIDHAEGLVREASKPKINDPAAMLVHLVTTGWIPPPVTSNGHGYPQAGTPDEEDLTGYLAGYCSTCAAITFGSCGHDEQPSAGRVPSGRGGRNGRKARVPSGRGG